MGKQGRIALHLFFSGLIPFRELVAGLFLVLILHNRLYLKTGKDNTWTEGRVRSLRHYQGIPVYSPEEQAQAG